MYKKDKQKDTRLFIRINKELKTYLQKTFPNLSEYVLDLILKDLEKREKESKDKK